MFYRFGVQPDELVLKPTNEMATVPYKLDALTRLIHRFPNLQTISVWDDDKENLVAFAQYESQLPQLLGRPITMNVINSVTVADKLLAQQRTFSERLVQNFILQHGLLRSNAFTK